MSALRKSADLQSVKTRRLVVQNEDGTFPPAYSLIATDAKGLGVTEWVQDISMNSVTLVGDASAGVLTYSDISGLLLNAQSVSGLPAPVPFDSVPYSPSVEELAQSYNELLAILNGKIISVNLPPSVTPTVIPAVVTADISWNPVGIGYSYTVYLNGIAQSPDTSGNTYTLTGLTSATTYTVAVASRNNSVFSSQLIPISFTTNQLPTVTILVGAVTSSSISLSWSPEDANLFSYNIYYHAGSNADTVIYDISGGSVVSYILTDLSANTTYSINVRATDGVRLGPSNPTTATTSSPIISFSFSDPPPSGYGPLTQIGTVTDNIVGFSMVPGNWIGKQFNRMILPLQCNTGTTVSVNIYNYPPTNAGNITNIGSATQVVANANMNNYTFNFNSIITLIYDIYNFNGTFILISCNSGTITVPTYNLNGIFPPITMVALKGQSAGQYSTYNQAVFGCQFSLVV